MKRSVTVAFPLGQVVVSLGLLFGNGAAAYLSRLLGRGDMKKADQVASTALYSGILTGAAMSALLAGALLNVVLDPVFIYTLKMGIAGAAIATAISQMVSAAVYLIYIFRKKSVFSFHIRACCFSKDILSEILKIGIPTLLFQLLTSLSLSMINNAAKDYGASALAAMGPVTKIMSMGSLIVFGFLKGFQPIAGYSYGAGKYDRLQEAAKTSLIWSTVFCAVFGLAAAAFSHGIMSQFTKDDMEMIRIGQKALLANGLSFLLFGFYTVYSFLFLVMGKAKEGCFLGACRQGICFVPVIYILPRLMGLNGILYAQPVADVLAVLVTAIMALHLHKELAVKRLFGQDLEK